MYISTFELNSCGGCLESLLDVGERVLNYLSKHEVSNSSLVDASNIVPSDVALVFGGIADSEDEKIAEEVSRATRKIIACGSCAVYGGIPAFGLNLRAGLEDLPRVFENARPLDTCMTIEYYIPGCPPPSHIIFEVLKACVEGYSPIRFDFTVCAECGRRPTRKAPKSWSCSTGGAPDMDLCLINHGLFCMGPVTRGGCHAACPNKGAVCIGCRGPSDVVLSSEIHSVYSDFIHYLSSTTGIRSENAEKIMKDKYEFLYLFTRRDHFTRIRPREKMPSDFVG